MAHLCRNPCDDCAGIRLRLVTWWPGWAPRMAWDWRAVRGETWDWRDRRYLKIEVATKRHTGEPSLVRVRLGFRGQDAWFGLDPESLLAGEVRWHKGVLVTRLTEWVRS